MRGFDNSTLINSGDIERNGLKWSSVDTIDNLLNQEEAFVVNTDISTGSGIHWIVMKVFDNTVFIIDPLGPRNYRPYDETMFETIHNNGMRPQFYPGSMQFKTNSLCGWFSIFMAKEINSNNIGSIKECIGLIDQFFGKNRKADKNDERVLVQAFGIKR